MNDAKSAQAVKEFENTAEGSFYGGNNPFYDIKKRNHDKLLRHNTYKKKVHSCILREFDEWDMVVTTRLRQVSEAILPELNQKPHFKLLRKLSRNNLFWMIFGRHVKYRILRNREEGMWELVLFNDKVDSSYGKNDLVRVRFVLDDRSTPVGFQLCRGSDNKMFGTHSLSGDELTRTLLCHFSRLSCGSNLKEDLDHLRFLHENQIISTKDYVDEKRRLLANRMQERFYVLPAEPAGESVQQKLRVGLFLTVLGILLLAMVVLLVEKNIMAEASLRPDTAILDRAGQ